MNAFAIQGLIRRRGSIVAWYHAIPPDPASINPMYGQPEVSLGGAPPAPGTFGERYPTDPVNIRGYISNKYVAPNFKPYGTVEEGDLQLLVAVPFAPEPWNDINELPKDLALVYTNGDFAVTRAGTTPYTNEQETMSYDRFKWGGRIYIAKARPVPLVDNDITFAWRIRIAEFSL